MENLIKEFPNVLTLRVRMPIVPDLLYPRNFITKIIKYDKVRVFDSGWKMEGCGGKARALRGAVAERLVSPGRRGPGGSRAWRERL